MTNEVLFYIKQEIRKHEAYFPNLYSQNFKYIQEFYYSHAETRESESEGHEGLDFLMAHHVNCIALGVFYSAYFGEPIAEQKESLNKDYPGLKEYIEYKEFLKNNLKGT